MNEVNDNLKSNRLSDNDIIEDKKKQTIIEISKHYYENRDQESRNYLIEYYMPTCKKIASKYSNPNNEEDLLQTAYETLIKTIDNYNPCNSTHISTLIQASINRAIISELEKEENNISLSNIDIYSNSNLEDMIVDKMYLQSIFDLIDEFLDKNKDSEYVKMLKEYYGMIVIEKHFRNSRKI